MTQTSITRSWVASANGHADFPLQNLPLEPEERNSYLGLIRQAQRGFEMDYCVQLAFDNLNAPELNGYGVDHVAVVQGLGCKALRVFEPSEIQPALRKAQELIKEFRVPVMVEIILERVTNISMGTEINAVNEFEDLALVGNDAPTAISMLD